MRALVLCLAGLALVQCSSPKAPPPAPPPPPPAPVARPTPPPPAATNWEDLPASPGDWFYRQDSAGSKASFGRSETDADLLVRCPSNRASIYIWRNGSYSAETQIQMTLRTTSSVRSYPIQLGDRVPPSLLIQLSPADRQLDALAFSRGRFLVSVKGSADLVVPAWPELARVIEDCRS